MTILDKLLEKKDVLAYINFRILSLKNDINIVMKSTPDKNRELIKERFNGRILELEELKTIVHQGMTQLKSKSKSYSRKNRRLNMKNQIIVAMDMEIPEGMKLMSKTRMSEQVYGYKIGSLWILDSGIDILRRVRDILYDSTEANSEQKIILDMQKWGTDIPDIIKKQVEKVAPYVDELICCPMGAGNQSIKSFGDACIKNDVVPICVVEMTHPNSDKYLKNGYSRMIIEDAFDSDINSFVIPATKEVSPEIKDIMDFYEGSIVKYATGFKTQGGQTKPMVDFGVTKFIVGRAIYESPAPISQIELIYKEINEE